MQKKTPVTKETYVHQSGHMHITQVIATVTKNSCSNIQEILNQRQNCPFQGLSEVYAILPARK